MIHSVFTSILANAVSKPFENILYVKKELKIYSSYSKAT